MRVAPFCSGARHAAAHLGRGGLPGTSPPPRPRSMRRASACPLNAPPPAHPHGSPGHSHTSDGAIVATGGDWPNGGFLTEGRYAVRTFGKDDTAWATQPEGLAYPHCARRAPHARPALLYAPLRAEAAPAHTHPRPLPHTPPPSPHPYPLHTHPHTSPAHMPPGYPTQRTLPDDRVVVVGGYASEADPVRGASFCLSSGLACRGSDQGYNQGFQPKPFTPPHAAAASCALCPGPPHSHTHNANPATPRSRCPRLRFGTAARAA